MLANPRKVVLPAFTVACIVSTAWMIWVGYSLFEGRPRLFWIFFAYIAALGCIVIFFGIKILNMKFPRTDKTT
ncbi:MAG TPA: hypothetical protein VFG95_04160 [Nitrospiria bacterium]|nr:hypothetical protein [Nitrospiria bacterium]